MLVMPRAGDAPPPSASHDLEGLAADQERVEPRAQRREVDFRIDDDPVVLAVGAGDEAVQAHGAAEHHFPHRALLT